MAQRYLFAKSNQNAINIIARITALVVVLGAFSLFVVLAGFAGLKTYSLQFINTIDPDIKVFPQTGKTLVLDSLTQSKISKINGLEAYSKVVEDRAFFTYQNKNHVGTLKGVDAQFSTLHNTDSLLGYGQWFRPDEPEAVVGYGVATALSLPLLDYENPLKIMAPKPGKGTINNPDDAFVERNFMSVGLFTVSEEIDKKYVFCDIEIARNLLSLKENEVSYIEIKITPTADEAVVRAALQEVIETPVSIKNRLELNASLYKMLNTENLATYLIFTLIIIVALFNVAGTTIMTLLDKKNNLKTLYSFGAGLKDIRQIFFLQGSLLSMGGAVAGIAIATVLIYLQQKFALVMITPTLPYPVEMEWQNYLIVFLTISVLGCLASLLAASRINAKLLL